MTLVTCFRPFRIVFATALALALAFPAGAAEPPPPFNLQPLLVETWNGWEDLGGGIGAPACVASRSNRLDCFAWQQGAGNVVARRQWNGTAWLSWTPFGGVPIVFDPAGPSRPECASWAPDHIDCFVRREPDTFLFRRTMEGAYTGGYEALGAPPPNLNLPGGLVSDPSCVSMAPGRLDCFAVGGDSTLHRISFDGDLWGPWRSLGNEALANTRPSCVIFRGVINCLTTRVDRQLLHWRIPPPPAGAVVVLTSGTQVQHPFLNAAGPRCVVSPGAGPGTDRLQCFAPTFVSTTFGLGLTRWISDGASWSLFATQSIPRATSYDWDCVARGGERVDCVELMGQPGSSPFPPTPTVGVTLRHVQLANDPNATVSNVVALKPVGGAFPMFVRCASWGPDRLDCFAGGGFLASTSLWHAWLVPARPNLPRPARPIP
jgi:hypothetical protein